MFSKTLHQTRRENSMLYHYVKRNLRVTLEHPDSLEEQSNALGELLSFVLGARKKPEKKDEKYIEHSLYFYAYKHRGNVTPIVNHKKCPDEKIAEWIRDRVIFPNANDFARLPAREQKKPLFEIYREHSKKQKEFRIKWQIDTEYNKFMVAPRKNDFEKTLEPREIFYYEKAVVITDKDARAVAEALNKRWKVDSSYSIAVSISDLENKECVEDLELFKKYKVGPRILVVPWQEFNSSRLNLAENCRNIIYMLDNQNTLQYKQLEKSDQCCHRMNQNYNVYSYRMHFGN